ELLDDIPHRSLFVPDEGFDIIPYFNAARASDYGHYLFLNSFSVILDDGWLAKLYEHALGEGVGVVGATGSYESLYSNMLRWWKSRLRWLRPYRRALADEYFLLREVLDLRSQFPLFPNYHVRSNAFLISRDLMLRLKSGEILKKTDAHRFESGRASMTRQILGMGLRPLVVGRDGRAYEKEDWYESFTFRSGEQQNLLVADNQTRHYEQADAATRRALTEAAWGGPESRAVAPTRKSHCQTGAARSPAPSKRDYPLVSIGLPVYNGERYLRQCLDSLLAQDYPNIELTISDNASTDATESICREYVARDARVRYHRAERNMGAVWNFRRVYELSRGDYFMWAAFDDLREPSFVSLCVEALESDPQAVMCCTEVRLVDEEGREIGEGEFTHGIRASGSSPWQRLRAIARANYWYDFYGVMRRSALERTRLPQPVWGFDVLLVTELCLLGPVLVVPEKLFVYRIFWKKSGQDAAATLGSGEERAAIGVSWIALAKELTRAVLISGLPLLQRLGLAARFLFEFCLRNRQVRESIRTESMARVRSAWREGRYWPSAFTASVAGLLSSVGLAERALYAVRHRLGAGRSLGR
ncbi:MAG: glycosyltransferase, partial [Acidobacteriota bacterium]|nr:glycosyltransferase [Acidobacteriota bacterium]